MLWRVWIKRPCRGCATAFSGLRAERAIARTIDGTTHEITVALAMTNGTNMRSGTIGAETVRHWAVQCARLQVQQKWYFHPTSWTMWLVRRRKKDRKSQNMRNHRCLHTCFLMLYKSILVILGRTAIPFYGYGMVRVLMIAAEVKTMSFPRSWRRTSTFSWCTWARMDDTWGHLGTPDVWDRLGMVDMSTLTPPRHGRYGRFMIV